MNRTDDPSFSPSIWIPRILIGLSILLFIYFTEVSYRFKGTYDESFLSEDNLSLVRGPLAHEDYYRMGQLGYQGKDPFEDALTPADAYMPSATPDVNIPTQRESKPATGPAVP